MSPFVPPEINRLADVSCIPGKTQGGCENTGGLKGKRGISRFMGQTPPTVGSRHDELKNEKRKKTVKIPKPLVYLFASIVFIFKSILQWRR